MRYRTMLVEASIQNEVIPIYNEKNNNMKNNIQY